MKDIKDVVGNRGVLVAEACNGFGKTACSLSSVLPLGHKVVYATRTHEQVRQVLLELERINGKARTDFSAVHLASRQHLCLNDKCRRLSAVEALEACRLLKEAGKCPYKTEVDFPLSSLPSVLSIRKLKNQSRIRKFCPYFLARKVAENCTLVVAPYQYIFNKTIRTRVKLEIRNKILIFDEAHNADQISQDVLSDTLSERSLNNAKQEMELVEDTPDFIDELAAYLDENVSEEATTKVGMELRRDLEHVLDVRKISSFVDSLSETVETIRTYKMERGDYPVCFLNGVLNFLSLVAKNPLSSYVAVYRKSSYGFNLVECRCLDPSLAIRPVIEEE